MALFNSNGNNTAAGTFQPARPVSSTASISTPSATTSTFRPARPAGNNATFSAPAPAAPTNPAPAQQPGNQDRLNSILGNSMLTPQQKQQQLQASGLGLMPIIYGQQSGSLAGTLAGGATPPPHALSQNLPGNYDWDAISKLYGADPRKLLAGQMTTGNSSTAALNGINQARASLGSNLLNNGTYGAAGTFSPLISGTNAAASGSMMSGTNPLSSIFTLLNILGASGANTSNNYTS